MNEELKNKLTERFNSAYGEEVKIGLRDALRKVYLDGVEHGYQYAIDKACEWLREHLGAPEGIPQAKAYEDAINELTTEFRKGMEV